MDERNNNAAITLFAAGAAAGLTLTYVLRARRARMRTPITQSVTVMASREAVESFIESRERMLEALESKRRFDNISRLELRDAPGERGTELYLSMRGVGKYGVKEVLRKAKALIESGEIPTGRRCA